MNSATQIRRKAGLMLLLAVSTLLLLVAGPRTALHANGDRVALDHGAAPFLLSVHSSFGETVWDGLSHASPEVGLAMADFTGDTHPDLATVQLHQVNSSSAQYSLEIQLTEGTQQILTLTAPFGGLEVTPKDVTGDGNLDLVVHSASSHQLVAIFLNDGAGHFHRADDELFSAEPSGDSSSSQLGKHATLIAEALGCPETHSITRPQNSPRPLLQKSRLLLASDFRSVTAQFLRSTSNRAPPSLV